ncbi:Aromatic-ring hydroxylase-like [Penicillium camemberti]|uniref:Aromatic-ring hydroxylase-like n=1 Tax=Penicillium camemberti (strain FM 013) TaxID=1429867 RepID=A0A0G4P8R6_PENC3|nr:Aromatic-ring hydroxylase-like [Penicillium camemberti]
MEMNIVIVGAGLGGLGTALALKIAAPSINVLVLEAAAELAEIGAGLQLTPNATRELLRWGLGDRLEKVATNPEVFTILSYKGDKLLGKRNGFGEEMSSKYGAPFWDMHRADLQIAMFERAQDLGVKFRFGVTVTTYDFEGSKVSLSNGDEVSGDLIIAADGLWSKARAEFLGSNESPLPTGDLAYRIVLNTEIIEDEDLKEFVSKPRVHLWVGPDCHAIYYPLRNNSMINIVLLVPDDLPENVAKAPGDIGQMKEIFRDWDPLLQRLLALVPEVQKWRLMNNTEMDSWCNEKGTIAFLGDACHPMLPYMAQGANSSLEDGAVLGGLIAKAHDKLDLPALLQIYQHLRKPRSLAIVEASFKQRHTNHLRNGPEQQQRDKILEEQFQEPLPGYPFYWLDPQSQGWIYSYNAYEEAEMAWKSFLRNDNSIGFGNTSKQARI